MTLKNKIILFIGGGFEQLEVIKNAKKYSKKIIVTNPEPNPEIKKYTTHIEILDPLNISKVKKYLKNTNLML